LPFLNAKHDLLVVIGVITLGICVEVSWGNPEKSRNVSSCADCHETEASAFAQSVHASAAIDCRTCHGGNKLYSVEHTLFESLRLAGSKPAESAPSEKTTLFDHGSEFTGKPSRKEIPQRCGNCHSDVEKMNPYGLPADQLAQYRISGHGQALDKKNDDRVAVCTDCHNSHAVMKAKDPQSPVYSKNVPATCRRCHSDTSIMADSGLSTSVVEEYAESVHGRGLLEDGDTGMPHCATCHGSHSAIPPGFRDVGHVCGRCHQQEEKYFMESPHAKFSLFPRCVGCHTRSVDKRDHRIDRIAASPESIMKDYRLICETQPGIGIDDPGLQDAYSVRREPRDQNYETYCRYCHDPAKQVSHRTWFAELDEEAIKEGAQLYRLTRGAELRYAATVYRVDKAATGVLLVHDEALMADELRTKLIELRALQHTLDLEKVIKATDQFIAIADGIDQSMDEKLRYHRWRYWALVPMWIFVAIFALALWIKYKRLKAAMVAPLPE